MTSHVSKMRTFKVRFTGSLLVTAKDAKQAAREAQARIASDTLQIDAVDVATKLVRVR